MRASPWARVPLTVSKPSPLSWPGCPEVSGASWGAGGQGTRGKGLWASQSEAPGRHVTPTLSQVGWFTGLAPQSCFNEKPRGPSAGSPELARRPGRRCSEDKLRSRVLDDATEVGHTPALQMFPGPPSPSRISLFLDPATQPPGSPHSSAPCQRPRPGYRHPAAKALAQAWTQSSTGGLGVQARCTPPPRTAALLALWPPTSLGQAASRRSSHLRPGHGPAHVTFRACRRVPGLCSLWPSISSRGAGPGRLQPGRRYLSETVLQALERGAAHGASCENPTLAVLAGQSSVLRTLGALPVPQVHCSWGLGPGMPAQGTQRETWPQIRVSPASGWPWERPLILTAYTEKPVSRPPGQ